MGMWVWAIPSSCGTAGTYHSVQLLYRLALVTTGLRLISSPIPGPKVTISRPTTFSSVQDSSSIQYASSVLKVQYNSTTSFSSVQCGREPRRGCTTEEVSNLNSSHIYWGSSIREKGTHNGGPTRVGVHAARVHNVLNA